jgi:hypothetical protein
VSSTKILATINPTKYSGLIYLIVKSDVDIGAKSYLLLENPKITKITDLNDNVLVYGVNGKSTDLYIVGTGFLGLKTVKFNDIEQTFTVESATKIKVSNSVLNTDGPVSISVETFGGTDKQSTLYNIIGLPTINFVFVTDSGKSFANKSGNEKLTITGTNFINLPNNPLELTINEQKYDLASLTISENSMEIITKPTKSGEATFSISNKAGIYRNYTESDSIITITNKLICFYGVPEITKVLSLIHI